MPRTFAAALLAVALALTARAADWPAFRGPNSDGTVTDRAVPTKWSATENVLWKAAVPGVGHSSPVVAAGRVFLTSFDPTTNDRLLLCYDRATGKQLWKQTVLTAAPEKMHKNNTPASASPVTDGKHVWCTFLDVDQVAVACYDADGKRAWLKHPGPFLSHHGFCGTPALHDGLLFVNGDSDGEAFLAALDPATGATKWKVDRPNRVRSFSVPRVLSVKGKEQLVLAGSKSVCGYEPPTGKLIWKVDSATDKFVATVAHEGGLVFATGTSPKNALLAIDPTGTGNVTESHVKWSDTKTAAYVPSPLAHAGRLFVLSDTGIATMLDSRTGKKLWSERLTGRLFHASPLLVNGLIYCVSEEGNTYVLKWGDEFEEVSKNPLAEGCHATPAVSAGQLFFRSAEHLWCVGTAASVKK